ncbi:MAG: hypothetical protein KF868_09075 [Acidobacteria bacterium]|nr:hypothetical protein [Acidobacteriota bacterium]
MKKSSINSIGDRVSRLKQPRWVDEEPIRAEVFGIDRLERYAATKACEQEIGDQPLRGQSLLPRFEDNVRELRTAFRTLTASVQSGQPVSPAAEWLVDNFHTVEEQFLRIHQDLPERYYVRLPKLSTGQMRGYPRIYELALGFTAHTDSRFDRESLQRFVRAYQTVNPLTIGELWAAPITLRLALIENLRRLTVRIVMRRDERAEADRLADCLLAASDEVQRAEVVELIQHLEKRPASSRAFVVQIAQRLRDLDPDIEPIVEWLERAAQAQESSIEQIVQQEHHRQAAAQATVGNIITSMNLLSRLDWRDIVESVSTIDLLLGTDPAGVYAQMDFATRDRYRHVVEELARRSPFDELEVAQRAIDLAQAAARETSGQQRAHTHVGYYLIDDGLEVLERDLNYRPAPGERMRRMALGRPTAFYFGGLALLTGLVLTVLAAIAGRAGAPIRQLCAAALLALPLAVDFAVTMLHWIVTHTFEPRILPKLDTEPALPNEARTMIVVPTMLTGAAVVEELIEKLEVHYLANQDERLHFALLADFADADTAEMPEDEVLCDAALAGIAGLNARYGPAAPAAAEQEFERAEGAQSAPLPRFLLLRRSRQWNAAEGRWIAWERKRGKLQEFNRLLRGATDTSFVVCTANEDLLSGIRYVITLDSDTQLPRDAARRLLATIRHPLNRAQIDVKNRRIVRGYSILQPRVSATLESCARSQFARILSGNTGIDPYSTAASDVYQDLFGEGSYTGKGLYDVDAFEAVLKNRVPDNTLLSHDLFEGLYARTALVSDIELLDDTPEQYDTWAKRQHRWTRGDWQIARWLLPRVPNDEGKIERNTLPLVSRWKIFDNLRRSLVAPALVLWLFAAWFWLPGASWWGTLFALLVVSFPVYAHVTTSLFTHPRGVGWSSYFWHVWGDFGTNTRQVALTCAFLAHQAWLMLDAIARVGYRKLVSGRRLLEWTTAAHTERHRRGDQAAFRRLLYPVTLSVLLAAAAFGVRQPAALWPALPFLLAWALAPRLAFVVSRPLRPPNGTSNQLGKVERRTLRLIARRTWRFFETFVGTDDHWLPPDNFQEDPRPLVAHRTSPTNIGLLLLSTVAARDFGYLSLLELVERLELTLGSIGGLEKYRGHLFNWYDTQKRAPLPPLYVSTVDSGNLAGHLIAVKQAALALSDEHIFDARLLNGFLDTLALLRDEAEQIGRIKGRVRVVAGEQLQRETEACFARINALLDAASPGRIANEVWARCFADLLSYVAEAEDIAKAMEQEQGAAVQGRFAEFHRWLALLRNQTLAARRDYDAFIISWEADRAADLTRRIEHAAPQVLPRWEKLAAELDRIPTLGEIIKIGAGLLGEIRTLSDEIAAMETVESEAAGRELERLGDSLARASESAVQLRQRADAAAQDCQALVAAMDFGFLLDETRRHFTIGYDVTAGRCDQSFYDLLASEARLTSLLAIAKGDAPQEHWFRLGRQSTQVNRRGRALVSWTATMFEYLMPLLVTRAYAQTLLDQTYTAIVARQIAYGREHGVPWGVSESAYNARDLQFNYQYGPFGVPGLGLKRGLSEDLVIAPYATLLATMIAPAEAVQNLERLAQLGALSRYGFYEAIDYTPERVPQGRRWVIIRSFMAHHQGMSLVALDNVLHSDVMQQRFHADPLIRATELLLQERIPKGAPSIRLRPEEVMPNVVNTIPAPLAVSYESPNLPTPRTQLLSNGNYSLLITSAGSGASWCNSQASGNWAVTRWREDATRDHWGSFCYLRDVHSGAHWSATYQPVVGRSAPAPQGYEATFTEERAVFKRRDNGIDTRTEILVSPEDNAELRCVTLTNRSSNVREIELTSYAEIVLATPAADASHPAFSNLFIETEFLPKSQALIARRRPRSPEETPVFAVHTLTIEGATVGNVQYETSRRRFLGRGHDTRTPLAITEDHPLTNTAGAVLDPIFSLRRRVRLLPNESVHATFSTAVAHSRQHIEMLADKYHDSDIFARTEQMAWTKAQMDLRHLNISPNESHLFQRLAGRVFYSDNSLRPHSSVLALNRQTQSALWKFGISGDLPIVLVRISTSLNEMAELDMVREILRGHEYLRTKGLSLDLVILNDHPPSYLQTLQQDIQQLLRSTGLQNRQDQPGGVYVLRSDQMPETDKLLLHAVARVVLVTERGSLETQLTRRPAEDNPPPNFIARRAAPTAAAMPPLPVSALRFFNGLGGFARDGREYVTSLNTDQWTPAPWLNVIANELDFGFQVAESGAGYTWSVNSRENRLTPWSNDAVSDAPGEIIYLRDEQTGAVWTPTPLPIREASAYIIRHGQGYTKFEHTSHGIAQELLLFVPLYATVKIARLRLENLDTRSRRLSVTSYHELVLGVSREKSAPFIVTERDEASGAVFARNSYNNEFASRIAFSAIHPPPFSATGDRKSFLGRNGYASQPAALGLKHLNERFGGGLDPCAALQTVIEFAPGETREVIILLGECDSDDSARALTRRFLQPAMVEEAFDRVVQYWEEVLTAVEVRTPDEAMNLMLNRWLLYQTIACRLWARSAFYQSGGAYGFRDQLQDVMALVYARPELARAQMLRAAARQFIEGDVQHWWHPPTGRGVRTRISDDLLWLPYVMAFYVRATGDRAILDEVVPFIEAPPLGADIDDAYLEPRVSAEEATLYEHCLRAIDRSLAVGAHGLPLIGAGDWNDGLNRVGRRGKGESVWLGWFLHATLTNFIPFCDGRDGPERVDRYRRHLTKLKEALETQAWDGNWYTRGFFDDGTPLGSAQNDECRIDSIPQSWAVLSGAVRPDRADRALRAVKEHLLRKDDGLMLLFTPPFDRSPQEPGYIKGYAPGVRENGGQYTHAAVWTLMAFAECGEGDLAGELFALLNPINRSATRAAVARYRVEPYVMAGDVYAVPPHSGRGGWTWYTGSAAWMYRAGLESILGFYLEGERLRLAPCIPRAWREFELNFRHKDTQYHIKVENPLGVCSGIVRLELDGEKQAGNEILLSDDRGSHKILVLLGEAGE